jgi:hypothetical protein
MTQKRLLMSIHRVKYTIHRLKTPFQKGVNSPKESGIYTCIAVYRSFAMFKNRSKKGVKLTDKRLFIEFCASNRYSSIFQE